jgi:hypothetical protein
VVFSELIERTTKKEDKIVISNVDRLCKNGNNQDEVNEKEKEWRYR